mmetsp:Transcript_37508/g.74256  ORF Transcript_37508/g.74256 Transcript_37508/m.74256 type:complete len:175 (+) Transcript_37508:72-596(+)
MVYYLYFGQTDVTEDNELVLVRGEGVWRLRCDGVPFFRESALSLSSSRSFSKFVFASNLGVSAKAGGGIVAAVVWTNSINFLNCMGTTTSEHKISGEASTPCCSRNEIKDWRRASWALGLMGSALSKSTLPVVEIERGTDFFCVSFLSIEEEKDEEVGEEISYTPRLKTLSLRR